MEEKDLITKWLNDELKAHELDELEKIPDFHYYRRIVENTSKFERPTFDTEKGLQNLTKRLSPAQRPVRRITSRRLYAIAAVLVLFLATTLFFWLNRPEVIATGNSEKLVLELPDQSTVKLNADSKITYRPSKWNKKRKLHLDGEAFFLVEKGKTFTVATDQGQITVLGTKFNVKDRGKFLQVACFEGAVKINVNDKEIILRKGNSVTVVDGTLMRRTNISDQKVPGWTFEESHFESIPLRQVIEELERQFDLEIETTNIDLDQLFTGSFSHTDKKIALKAVTAPLQIDFTVITEKKVKLYEK